MPTINGTPGDDYLYGTTGDDAINGSAGNDVLDDSALGGDHQDGEGFGGVDILDGGTGIDGAIISPIVGLPSTPVNFTFNAGASTPAALWNGTTLANIEYIELQTGSSDDTVTFNGICRAYDYTSFWNAGPGNDTAVIDLSAFSSSVYMGQDSSVNYEIYFIGQTGHYSDYYGHDYSDIMVLSNIEHFDITAGSGNDDFYGGDGSDIIRGGAGNDGFAGYSGGDDIFDGGSGTDLAAYTYLNFADAQITFENDGSVQIATGSRGTDTLINTEQLDFQDSDVSLGSAANDTLTASIVYPRALGGFGNDTFLFAANVGTAYIDGGTGTDTAVFSGQYQDYVFDDLSSQDVHVSSSSFSAYLHDVEVLNFSDGAASFVNGTLNFVSGQPALSNAPVQNAKLYKSQAFAPALLIQDADDTSLQSAEVQITSGKQQGDLLSVSTTGTAITATFNSMTGKLTLSGSDTLAHYQAVLRSVEFTAGTSNGIRTIRWKIIDDDPVSNIGTLTTAINVNTYSTQDFNSDGRSDLVFQSSDGPVAIWLLNAKNGAHDQAQIGNPGAAWHVRATGDFDGDAHADILYQNDDGTAAIWLMNGAAVSSGSGVGNPGPLWRVMGAGDFNGDGKSDILYQNTDGMIAVWLMNGLTVLGGNAVVNLGTNWCVKAVADFNQDGKSDVLFQSNDGSLAISLMNGAARTGISFIGSLGSSHLLGVGDFDGDDHPDLLTKNISGQLEMVPVSGASLAAGVSLGSAANELATEDLLWTVGDLDGDGTADIIGQSTGRINGVGAVLVGDPNYNFILTPGSPGAGLYLPITNKDHLAKNDFSGDGKSDILYQNANGYVAVWLIDNANVLGGNLVESYGSNWHAAAAGDYDADGKSDILYQKTDGSLTIWSMNGYQISSGQNLDGPGASWHVDGAGDFNGDGNADILYQNDDGSAAIWLMNGTRVSGGSVVGNAGRSWHIEASDDFNGDGKADILYQNDNGAVAVWLMNTLLVTGGSQVGNPGVAWHVEATGDFNGDGRADILYQNDDGQAAIWMMDGTTVLGGAAVGSQGPGWQVAAAGDYNADGKSDILWQNSDGRVATWTMSGLTLLSAANVGNPGASWHAVTG
jgi:Ca2+-binding RTX toxin-like protein